MRRRIGAKPQQQDLDGTTLDQPIWTKSATKQIRRYKVVDGNLQAGIINNIGNGTIVALYAKPDDRSKKLVAHARTGKVEAFNYDEIPLFNRLRPIRRIAHWCQIWRGG